MRQRHLKKKEILRKVLTCLLKISLWNGFSFCLCRNQPPSFSVSRLANAEGLFNINVKNVKGLQVVRLATLLKKDPRTGASEPAVRRCSTKQLCWSLFLNKV